MAEIARPALKKEPDRADRLATWPVGQGVTSAKPQFVQEVKMERGRILIMGQTKESTYEIRNLLDNKRFELEIALSSDVGKNILSQRYMNLLILHTEALGEESSDFLQFLEERGLEIPVLILGEESARYEQVVPGAKSIKCFDKPYAVSDMLSTIEGL